MSDLIEPHQLLRISHALVGLTGLALFWIPVFARKGGRLHLRSGKLFVWCAYYVGITGLLASAWGLVHPASFIGDPELDQLDPAQRRIAIENVRFILAITGFLALGVMSGVLMGVRVMRTKAQHERLRSPLLIILEMSLGLWSAGLALYGVCSLVACYAGWHFLPPNAGHRYWLSAVLGAYGLYGAIGDLKYILGPRPEPMAWWTLHMQYMLGSGAGFHAAFFLFGARRFLAIEGGWQLLAPLVPLVVGGIASEVWVRHYQRKFERQSQLPLEADGELASTQSNAEHRLPL